jgi:hypothetical protein
MSNRFKAALIFAIGMTAMLLFRGIWEIVKTDYITAIKMMGFLWQY